MKNRRPIFFSFNNQCSTFRSGIALLEIMVATAVFGIALITLGAAIGRCVQSLSTANRLQQAVDLAEHQLEEWKVSVANQDEVATGSEEGEKEIQNRVYSWSREIEETKELDLLKFTLTIRWHEGQVERQWKFVSIVNKNPKSLVKKS